MREQPYKTKPVATAQNTHNLGMRSNAPGQGLGTQQCSRRGNELHNIVFIGCWRCKPIHRAPRLGHVDDG